MKVSMSSLLFVVLSISLPAAAQSPSLAGEWRIPAGWVVVIEQTGAKVIGSWKRSYTDKALTCSGISFEGTVSGESVSGTRTPCGGARTEPLRMKIVGANTLEMAILSRGGAGTKTVLTRIK